MTEITRPLKVIEVAELIGVPRSRVYQLIETGELASFTVGEKTGLRIMPDEVNKWIAGRLQKAAEHRQSSSEETKDTGSQIGAIKQLANAAARR